MNSSNLPAQKISDKQLKEMLESSNPPLVIDVRPPKKYAWNHIPQSKNIPIDNFQYTIKKMNLQLNHPIVVYCQIGINSDIAANILRRLGFTNVYNFGKIDNWHYKLEH